MRKPRSYAEVYNDLDDDVVNLFCLLRDPASASELRRQLELTPFSRTEFLLAYEPASSPIERARQLVIRSFMGHGSDAPHNASGFRANSNKSGTTPAHDWANFPASLDAAIERLSGVIIEKRDAWRVMEQHDSPATLHYVDPPYLPETRGVRHAYAHELTVEQHCELLEALGSLQGMVVLSGYPSALYESRLPGWRRVQRQAYADGARKRIEVLWINPAASAALATSRIDFFAAHPLTGRECAA